MPECGLCNHFDGERCEHYGRNKLRRDWGEARDCRHFDSMYSYRILRYNDPEAGSLSEFTLPVICTNDYDRYPKAADVVNALRKAPRWADELDKISAGTDEQESFPEKWELAEK